MVERTENIFENCFNTVALVDIINHSKVIY